MGHFVAVASDKKASECCGSVSGQTLELPKGNYELVEWGDYFHVKKAYSISEGRSLKGEFSKSGGTSPNVMRGKKPAIKGRIGSHNIDIGNSRFSGARMHTGGSCLYSRGCPIVGDNAVVRDVLVDEEVYPGAREGQDGKTISIHTFDYYESWEKAVEISTFVECVSKIIKKPNPSIEVSISEVNTDGVPKAVVIPEPKRK